MGALDYDIVADDLSALGPGPTLVTFGEVMVRDTPADEERLERAPVPCGCRWQGANTLWRSRWPGWVWLHRL